MKLYIKNRIKGIISKKDKVSQIQRNLNNITDYNISGQTISLSDFHQTRNQTKLVNINVERSKAWALQTHRNQRVI
jgi:hypothetical protein